VSKQTEVADLIRREVRDAVMVLAAEEMLTNHDDAVVIRRKAESIGGRAAGRITEHYRFLQLADIMGWKSRAVKR
jgi:hypothetical protein